MQALQVKLPKGVGIQGDQIYVDPDNVYPVVLKAMGYTVDLAKQAGGCTRNQVLTMKRVLRQFLLQRLGYNKFVFTKSAAWRTKITDAKRTELLSGLANVKYGKQEAKEAAEQLHHGSLVKMGEPVLLNKIYPIALDGLNKWWREAQLG